MCKKITFILFFLVFSTEAFSMNEDERDPVFPYLMRAVDSKDNSALCVATHHGHPWESLPEGFKAQILSKNVGVFESCEKVDPEEVLRRFSRESLPAEVFLPEEESWKATYGHDLFQKLYSQIAQRMQEKGFDYSYLNNISTVCPGFLAYLNMYFVNTTPQAVEEGMDSSIQFLFKQQGKRLISLEKRRSENIMDTDDWKSYSMTTASYDDVIADFKNKSLEAFIRKFDSDGCKKEEVEGNLIKGEIEAKNGKTLRTLSSFQEEIRRLENNFYEDQDCPTILCYNNALGKRNRLYMPTILEQVTLNEAVIAVGDYHFVGPEGILSLGQEEGLRWQYYNGEKEEWEDFTYKPSPPPEKKQNCLVS